MAAGGVIGEEGEDGPASIGDELLADARKDCVVPDARVLGALVLANVVPEEGEEITALLTLDVDAGKALARFQLGAPPFPGRAWDIVAALNVSCHSLLLSLLRDAARAQRLPLSPGFRVRAATAVCC